MLQEALDTCIRRRVLGENHPSVVKVLHCIDWGHT
jgi:hypothetical protein